MLNPHATRWLGAHGVACGFKIAPPGARRHRPIVTVSAQSLIAQASGAKLPVMPWTLAAKIEAEQNLRDLLRREGLPQPDEVEYGHTCVRFLFHESKACVVIDLDES